MNPASKLVQTNQQEFTAAETLATLCRSLLTSSPRPTALPIVVQAPIPDMPALPASVPYAMPLVSTIRPFLEQPTAKTNKEKKKFPQKLHEILETPEHSDILRWLPGGKAFVIDKKRFRNHEELPAFLKQTQYTSFTRKLFRWKFVCVPHGPFMGAYYHQLFRKDDPALCKLMSCNNNVPSLAVIAQTRQSPMHPITTAPKPNTMDSSISQQNALQILEEANRAEQLLNIRLKKAHLYEQQKRNILRHVEASRAVPALLPQQARQHPLPNQSPYPQQVQTHHTQFYANDNSSSNSLVRILQDAIAMDYNTYMSQLAKFR